MNWQLSDLVGLRNDRVPDMDADRQQRTAAEILRRLNDQPGVILADEVGMGKTYVALAVAVSVLQATHCQWPIVVMAPSGVADKWPTEWAVFAERCLRPGHGFRASAAIRRGSDFLKLLDDPAHRRHHLIFITHGALTSHLNDPFIRLALLRRAMLRRSEFADKRRAVARFASSLLNDRRFDAVTTAALLSEPTSRWKRVWARHKPGAPLDDDPVPLALEKALGRVDLAPLRQALATVPLRRSGSFDARVQVARRKLNQALKSSWTESLRALDESLPLLILDEAHHVKNQNQLAGLFANKEAERDAEALQGPLGNMFDRMLFLTATPFQLGHGELLRVLDRFHGIRWWDDSARARFDKQLSSLATSLDRAQASALRLERAWSRIDPLEAPMLEGLTSFGPRSGQSEPVRTALSFAAEARRDISVAEEQLRPWVVRHVKAGRGERRAYHPGRSILDDGHNDLGLPVTGQATLPFLLAARAQALASLDGPNGARQARAYFAYGLASSFEAYADTRRNRTAQLDDLGEQGAAESDASPQMRWYLDHIEAALPRDIAAEWASHPKVAATVERVRQLWLSGEKSLVFCFYVETGRALRSHISHALQQEIIGLAARALNLDATDGERVLAALDAQAERLLRSDARGYTTFRARVRGLARNLDPDTQERVADVATRFMRTASFLVRYVRLSPHMSIDDLLASLEIDLPGGTLADRIRAFAATLERKVDQERDELLTALTRIQTGGIVSKAEDFDPSERASHREVLLPNVRLANGGVQRETRRRLMLAFNTPFFPEVLVASAVMAEGVDLQQDCRHVIHHDLDWNPSTLEQRTGRIDRIGSKAEAVGRPVVVYEPYLSGTYDEKMYRVVKDRERWFGVVMGQGAATSERATEQQATRVPLPKALADSLTMHLALGSPK
jgi:superfamily II DNA or RNA helicase